ncbi:Retinoic acid induced 16-like protein-domain-containing protein [Obelidium mucronatum]|nr:Retinoic acid induced 16-like protein-domain-containing protein [Obelidium mucronatum]
MSALSFFSSFLKPSANPLSPTSVGLGLSSNKRMSSVLLVQPGALLYKFQRAWDNIVVDWETESNWTKNIRDTDIPRNLDVIVDILVKEHGVVDGGVQSGGCTEKFLGEDMLTKLVAFSDADVPNGFRGYVIAFVTNLLLVLDPKILVHNAIHRPILNIIESCLPNADATYDRELLQLELDICGKIYDHPSLLYIFFSKSAPGKQDKSVAFEATSPSLVTGHDFFIFDHILRYLHDDGVSGDFARRSALFLVELAAGDLAVYINTSDFSAVSIAGLGGVFSQLPPRIPNGVKWTERFKGHSIGDTTKEKTLHVRKPLEVFRNDVECLVRVFEFVQGVVLRCPNADIATSILEDFQGTFLDNIVAGSLSGASDFDGSTASTLFYIQKMLETVNEECMAVMMLQFLLSSDAVDDEDEEDEAKKKALRKSMHRRSVRPSSIMMTNAHRMSIPTPTEAKQQDLKLRVRDILMSKLASVAEEVVIATLNLLRTAITLHPVRAIHFLIERLPQPEPSTGAADQQNDDESTTATATTNATTAAEPALIPEKPQSTQPVPISADTHLWLVSRYFALVPAESPTPPRPIHLAPKSGPQQPLDLFNSLMDSFVSGGETVARGGGVMVQGPNNVLVPLETSLSSYVGEAEKNQGKTSSGTSSSSSGSTVESGLQKPRAKGIDLEELLLLGESGGSKGNDVQRRKKKKRGRKTGWASLVDVSGDDVGGVLKRGSVERNMMLELVKDGTLKKLFEKFEQFFSHTYDINLALTGLLSQLVSAPIPILYHYLFSADVMLGPQNAINQLLPTKSIYTILLRLRREVEDRRTSVGPAFNNELQLLREELFEQRRKAERTQFGLNFEEEFYKNVVLLEEFTKELLSILVAHAGREYDEISYVLL